MMKAKAVGQDGKEMVILGLSRENVNRLTAGQPIVVNDMDIPGVEGILIMFGETEQALYDEVRQHADIPREVIKVDPKLKDFKP